MSGSRTTNAISHSSLRDTDTCVHCHCAIGGRPAIEPGLEIDLVEPPDQLESIQASKAGLASFEVTIFKHSSLLKTDAF